MSERREQIYYMEEIVNKTIKTNDLIHTNDKIVVGVSGGPDSIALLHYLSTIDFIPNIQIYAAHLNHKIRGIDADKDEKYVRAFCRKNNITCYAKKIDVLSFAKKNKLSLEDAGRACRYKYYEGISKKIGADKIALAHTADDNIETFLMRLLRGSGMKGLCAIPQCRSQIIRPFIDVWKKDVLNYCKTNKLEYAIDKSNNDTAYTRNKIRNKLIPQLKKYNPQVKEAIIATIKSLSDDYGFISQETNKAFKKIAAKKSGNAAILNRSKLLKLPASIQSHVLRMAIETIKGNLKNISFSHLCDIIKLKRGSINLPDNIIIKHERDHIIISNEPSLKTKNKSFCYKVKIPGEKRIDEIGSVIKIKIIKNVKNIHLKHLKKEEALIDLDKIDGDLTVRNFRKGDYIVPLGMSGRKKLHDYFIDEKIPVDERHKIPIITDDKKVVWIAGHRLSDEVRIDGNTKKIIRLSVVRLETSQGFR